MPRSGPARSEVALLLIHKEAPHCSPQWLDQFTFPLAVEKGWQRLLTCDIRSTTKEKTNKLDFVNVWNARASKRPYQGCEKKARRMRETFANRVCDKNLHPECAQKSSTIKENFKWAKDLNKCFSKVGKQTNKYPGSTWQGEAGHSGPSVVRETQIHALHAQQGS